MQKKSFLIGALIGAIAPLLAYVITVYTSLQQSLFADKPIAFYVIASVINVVMLRFTFRGGKESLAKGILMTTFLAMLVLIFVTKLKVG